MIILLISEYFNFEILQKLDEIPSMIDAAVFETEITSESFERTAEGKIIFRF